MNICIITVAMSLSLVSALLYAQGKPLQTLSVANVVYDTIAANAAWGTYKDCRTSNSTNIILKLNRCRIIGLSFVEKYPEDPRRWEWLVDFANPFNFAEYIYYRDESPKTVNINIDTIGRAAWEQKYAVMRAAFMESPQVSEAMKTRLLRNEFSGLSEMLGFWINNGLTVSWNDIELLQSKIIGFYDRMYQISKTEKYNYVRHITAGRYFTPAQVARYYAGLVTTKEPGLRAFAELNQGLYQRRLDDSFTDINGRSITLSQLRGKIVLVDFWGINCSSCIAAFPKIKAIYEKYHKRGFEVITVSTDGNKLHELVISIYMKHKLPWTLVHDRKDYTKTYAIYGVPYMLLVNKKGYLIDNGIIEASELEDHLERLLPAVVSTSQ